MSNRQIICDTTLSKTKNWLLDVVFDSRVLERKNIQIQDLLNPQNNQVDQIRLLQAVVGGGSYEGPNSQLLAVINSFLSTLFSDPATYRIGIGGKNNRVISIMRNEKAFVPDIQQLSTGQALIFSLFCSILRDFDKTGQNISSTNDVQGLVVIDEIDLHLHTSFQFELLPKLLRFFPNVQFIVTSHSPLFLLGMNKTYGYDGFDILNLPKGERISAELFSEFHTAYNAYGESTRYQESIRDAIIKSRKPIVFVEGDYDIRYLNKAAEFLKKTELIEEVELKDSNGFGNIDKIWKHFNSDLSSITPQNILLLYDCDTNKQGAQKDNVFKRVIPCQESNPVEKGIENLLSKETLTKATLAKKAFIDVFPTFVKTVRGKEITVPEEWTVNKDEKGNLCDWICENGELKDFENFRVVFDILEETLN
ncbi:AAA family ATPase [Marivirga tractuosa]|uniref:AAA family ATPase n=1 Tax=Marivirga tractuosa TaxID=1006 RepID=UPI0030C89158